jgi:hypothetical protein
VPRPVHWQGDGHEQCSRKSEHNHAQAADSSSAVSSGGMWPTRVFGCSLVVDLSLVVDVDLFDRSLFVSLLNVWLWMYLFLIAACLISIV